MSISQNSEVSYGIAIVANDKVHSWLLPFLESYRATNADIPLHLIPFDDNVTATRRAAELYGAIWVNDDTREVDALAKRLYPLFPHHRRRLRKLQALALPLDRVIYLDVDTILFRSFRNVFQALRPGETEFVIASVSEEYVYNRKRADHAFLDGVTLFNDGFFLTSRRVLSLADFERIIAADEDLFHAVRKRGMLFAQPLVNFVVHRLGLKVRSLGDCVEQASNESFYKAEGIALTENGPLDWQGREIYFAHWAGATGTPKRRVFDALWLDYARRARERMAA
jgi:alpha-N-acetylglucosamine transferase